MPKHSSKNFILYIPLLLFPFFFFTQKNNEIKYKKNPLYFLFLTPIRKEKILTHFPIYFASAFTLVELIVVIAVLAVLAAIAFATTGNISSNARDSARLTDLSSLRSSLDSFIGKNGVYPVPDGATTITWSGASAWSQGVFGENTMRALGTISSAKDPKWNNYYTYSLANNKREYEVAAILEKASSYIVNQAYAAGEKYETTTKGTYNGVAIRVASGSSINWILSVPTIIAGDIKDANLVNVVLSTPKSGYVPDNYRAFITNSGSSVFPIKQVWSGSTMPATAGEMKTLANALANAYSGTNAV